MAGDEHPPEGATSPRPGRALPAPDAPSGRRCPECGAVLHTAHRFCGACGARLADRPVDDGRSRGAEARRGPGSHEGLLEGEPEVVAFIRLETGPSDGRPGGMPRSARVGRALAAALVVALVAGVAARLTPGDALDAATTGHAAADRTGAYDAPVVSAIEEIRWRRDQQQSAYRPLGRPVVDGDAAFVANASSVSAVDLAVGGVRWRAEVPGATSLATDHEHVYVRSHGRLFALDRDRGTMRWNAPLGRGVYDVAERVAPVAFRGAVHVATPTGALRSFEPDGERRWALSPDDLVEAGSGPRFIGGLAAAGDRLVVVAWGRDAWGRATAVDPVDGSILWSANVGAALPYGPIIVGGAVLLVGPDQLVALDVGTGRQRWHRDLPLDTAGDVLVAPIGGNLAVLTADGHLLLHDWFDGDETRVGTWEGGSPVRMSRVGHTVRDGAGGLVVQTATGELVGYDVVAGRERWRTAVGVASAASEARGTRIVTPTEDGFLVGIEPSTGTVVWRTRIRDEVSCQLSGGGDLTYLTTADGVTHAFDTRDGTVSWSLTGGNGVGAVTADATTALVLDGGVIRLVAPSDGTITATATGGGSVQPGLALTDSRLLVSGSNSPGFGARAGWIRSIDRATLRSRWLTYVDTDVVAPITLSGDVAVVAGGDGRIVGLSVTDGRKRWATDLRAPATGPAAAAGDLLLVGDLTGGVHALSREDGRVRWTHETGVVRSGAPAVARVELGASGSTATLAIVPGHTTVTALDVLDGEVRWTATVTAGVTSSPSVAGDAVYVGTNAGLAVLSVVDGGLRQEVALTAPVVAPPVLGPEGAVVCLATGSVLALGR